MKIFNDFDSIDSKRIPTISKIVSQPRTLTFEIIRTLIVITFVVVLSWGVSSANDIPLIRDLLTDTSIEQRTFSTKGQITEVTDSQLLINTPQSSYTIDIQDAHIKSHTGESLSKSTLTLNQEIIAKGLLEGTTITAHTIIIFTDLPLLEELATTTLEFATSTDELATSTDELATTTTDTSSTTEGIIIEDDATITNEPATSTDTTASSTDSIIDKITDTVEDVIDTVTDTIGSIIDTLTGTSTDPVVPQEPTATTTREEEPISEPTEEPVVEVPTQSNPVEEPITEEPIEEPMQEEQTQEPESEPEPSPNTQSQ